MATTPSIHRGLLLMVGCPCLIPDENDNCTDCGKHIDVPDAPCPDLGDIPAICKLIDATAATCAKLVADNTDPQNPNLPRLRMVGGQIMRIPHNLVYKDLLGPSYLAARDLGYRGTFDRWNEIIRDAAPTRSI